MWTNSAQDHDEEPMAAEELLQGHLELWHHALAFIKSAALLCAMELRIPDAIVRCGGAASLEDLVTATNLPQSNLPFLRRLMRALTASRIFAVRHGRRAEGQSEATTAEEVADASVPVYELTAASQLLVTSGEGGSRFSLFPCIRPIINSDHVSAMLGMHEWIKQESAPSMPTFVMAAGGMDVWEDVKANPIFRAWFYDAMDADTRVVMHAILRDRPAIFEGLTSLVDVGGGRGTAAAAIVTAFPDIKCTVLELPHVVASEAPKDGINGLCFVAGDMFEHIPPADAILLKWVLHDWDDDNCVKILRQCKKAINDREGNTKVLIMDIVIGSRPNDVICKETQVLCDIYSMNWLSGGIEREEHEWRKIFIEAGFSDYRITPVHGIRSVIEVYA